MFDFLSTVKLNEVFLCSFRDYSQNHETAETDSESPKPWPDNRL
jgi:hypothetical protein